ncbi:MAG: 5'-methylthioadenosine/adenosylhomocysteine nucleosidase [Eubacterium sp.]|nr:5'-methylthioadenosine/adenosylhomocysteine nucleosidase [Eubacterium sp.]
MKTVLIIGAMEEEILPLVSEGNFEKKEEALFPYYTGTHGDMQLIVTVSKVGKVAMAACVQHFITLVECQPDFAEHRISLVINMGVAGAIASSLNQGDIVVGDRLCQHDMDVAGLGYEPGLNPDYSSVYFETPQDVIDTVVKAYERLDTSYTLTVGTIASGDQFISSKEKKEFIENTFGAYACEMEGASLAQVCSDNQVPFLVIRAISDKADGDAPLSYGDFKAAAIRNLTALVKEALYK